MLQKVLKQNSKILDSHILLILNGFKKEVKKISPDLVHLVEAFIITNKGGKRVRGFLIKLGYDMASLKFKRQNSKNDDEIYKIGAAYEIFHSSILAHDDIIDQSPLRRGKPSLYKALGGGHYGISQAISLADCGFFLSVKIISESNFPPDYKIAAINYFAKTVMNTSTGEILDVELPFRNSREERDVIKIMELKTARYTIGNPLQLGAILAGADEVFLGQLGLLGKNLGIAFQIKDDILGAFGKEKKMGKSSSSDIAEGKNTLLLIEALKKADKKQKRILKKYYGNGENSKKALESVREVFLKTNALQKCEEIARKYALRAKKIIQSLMIDKKHRQILLELVDYSIERNK